MKALLFVPYDDPQVVNFFQAGAHISDSPIIFIEESILDNLDLEGVTYMITTQRGGNSLEEYVTTILKSAKEFSEENQSENVVCLLPYPEFIEIVYTKKSLEVANSDFFEKHHFYSFEPGEAGVLYELRAYGEGKTQMHRLTEQELRFLPYAN